MVFFHSWKVSPLKIKADLLSHFLSRLTMFSNLENRMKSWPNDFSVIFLNLRDLILRCVDKASLMLDYSVYHGANSLRWARGNQIKLNVLTQHVNIHINTTTNYKNQNYSWEVIYQCGMPELDPWVGKIPWSKERLTTPVFCPG